MTRPHCGVCGEELSFPLRKGLRVYCFQCAPDEAKPKGRWVPGTPVDNRAGWVKRLDKNAKVLA